MYNKWQSNRVKLAIILYAILSIVFSPALANESQSNQTDTYQGNVTFGRDLAKKNCARCHDISLDGASPIHQAVPFWRMTIHRDVSTIASDLFNKAMPKHNIMPTFSMTEKQAKDIAAWIAWVQPIAHGKRLLEENCARCHAIGKTDEPPHPDAIKFRELHQFYPPDALYEAFSEGIEVNHPDMPIFKMTELQVADILIYLESIQVKTSPQ